MLAGFVSIVLFIDKFHCLSRLGSLLGAGVVTALSQDVFFKAVTHARFCSLHGSRRARS